MFRIYRITRNKSAVQNHSKSNKTAILDFSKAEGVIRFNSDYFDIEQHALAEKSLSSEEQCIVEEHDNGGKKGTLACQQKVISSNSGKTGLTGSINRSDRSMEDTTVGCHQEEKHDIIHIKVPRLSKIFDKICCTSNLFNSQSDHMVSVDASSSKIIVSNPRRSIEEGNLLASSRIISDSIGQCIVKIRKADNSDILAFKLTPASLPKIFSTWFTCGYSRIKSKKPIPKSIVIR